VSLNVEKLKFGLADKSRYGTYSLITVGHGPNGKWTYGLSISFGTAGSFNGLSVYGTISSYREDALGEILAVLKKVIEEKVEHMPPQSLIFPEGQRKRQAWNQTTWKICETLNSVSRKSPGQWPGLL